jgi:hypothetical protein
MPVKPKYPPYPDANWDYSVRHCAAMALQKPNKTICVYCHGQAPAGKKIPHKPDCPAKNDE